MRTSKCKACGAPIIWIQTIGNKSMPCDPDEVYYTQKKNGTKRIVTKNGETLACELTDIPESATGVGYIPHWSTCTETEKFRERRNYDKR